MNRIKNQIIKSSKHSKSILYDAFYKPNSIAKPIVIFCHGFKGYKDWGSWNLMAEHFANENYFFVKFNFSHNGGTVENPIDFPDLENFSKNNFTKELHDLEDVIEYLSNKRDYKNQIDLSNINLIGHSRGGGIVTLKAGHSPKISKVISWAGISDIESRIPKGEELAYWKQNKTVHIYNGRTKQQMPLDYQFVENFEENKELLNIEKAVKNITIPHLIIHGKLDDVVLEQEAMNLHKWNASSELFIVKDMNHALGNNQPWKEPKLPKDMITVINKTIQFIKQ